LIVFLNITFLPSVALCAISGVYYAFRRIARGQTPAPEIGAALYLGLLCYAGALLVDLTAAMANSLDISRYFEFHLVLTLLGHASALLLAVLVLYAGITGAPFAVFRKNATPR
jgi:hypothetical protein